MQHYHSKTRLFHTIAWLLVFSIFSPLTFAANDNSPTGLWRTYDEDNTPRSIMRITESNGRLQGRVVKSLPTKGQLPTDRCTKCTDSRKDQLIQGMVVLSGLTKQGDTWTGGWILDPYTGNSYRCYANVSDDDSKLRVHVYVAVPALGRTIEWVRLQ